MAKTVIQQKVKRTKIYCNEFTGYIDEMPQEAKDALVARNPKAEILFEKWVAPAQIVE